MGTVSQGPATGEGSRLSVTSTHVSQLPTPINVDNLEYLLDNYNPILKKYLISGFRHGFDIGFRGEVNCNPSVRNLQSTKEHKLAVTEALAKEVLVGRIAGPFASPPFSSFQLNPIGIVPKKEPNKFRMIFDLSYPPGKAINNSIDDEHAHVQYASMNDAVTALLACGPHAYMAKTDIAKAFRLVPICPSQYHLLCVKWDGVYYYDKALTMGCRSSCKIFQSFSDALVFIASSRGIQHLINMLDDFLIVASSKQACLEDLREFRAICMFLGVPLVSDKTFLPAQIMIFLGLEYDSVDEVVRLPSDKLTRCREGIAWLLGESTQPAWLVKSGKIKSKGSLCTLKELQSILGLLSFACTVVVPGRAFLKRLFALTAGVRKPHFFVKISQAAKADLRVWQDFLNNFNGVTLYRTELFLSEKVCHFFTDASKTLGCGAVCDNSWFSLEWPSAWWKEQNITFLELVPIVLALEVWGERARNQCVLIHSDNLALVHVINSQSSKEDLVMGYIRRLVLKALHSNVLIKAVHIPGVHNILADLLSRLQVPQFLERHPTADKFATTVNPLPHFLDSDHKQ